MNVVLIGIKGNYRQQTKLREGLFSQVCVYPRGRGVSQHAIGQGCPSMQLGKGCVSLPGV